ncbi:response regulator [Pseudolabrys taiwanensis]|uniref:Regulatory protein VirG n=1 Tax=Pseudolabrys taiwanensis TaxID=331696 RepID=A0A346A228_9HYPH|nr:response regulator [Pseudolabrys taiwanensis]AXK83225.1 response regulator [Pseudolabrys taiwanensis]
MSKQPHILVVEDDREISALVARYLRTNECRVSLAANGRELDRLLDGAKVDLIVLDLMLPGEDGLSLCKRLRARSPVPIIMLTAKSDEVDRILGLEMGADDYMPKPFNPRELLARIRAVLRRAAGTTAEPTANGARMLTFVGWQIDRLLREVRNPAGARVALTDAEFGLLQAFCDRPQRVLSRDQLLELTQGRTAAAFERSVDILVSRLRRKIEPDPQDPSIIKTVRSGGYLFTPAVETA